MRVKMTVMPESEVPASDATILSPQHDGPAIQGDGDTDHLCGSCGKVLLRRVALGQIRDVFVRCTCGAVNLPRV